MEKLSNHIEEYLIKQEGNRDLIVGKEIFKADDNVDIKTDLNMQEISYINTLFYNNDLLVSKKLKPVYKDFLTNYMRLKISLDRKSRKEYVDVNRSADVSKMAQDLSNIKNITDVKKWNNVKRK